MFQILQKILDLLYAMITSITASCVQLPHILYVSIITLMTLSYIVYFHIYRLDVSFLKKVLFFFVSSMSDRVST